MRSRFLSMTLGLSVVFLLLGPGSSAQGPRQPTLTQLVGQRIMVRMRGPKPSASVLGRIKRGEIGGVALFSDNYRSADDARKLIVKLRTAARAGRQLPLLIAIDQEGGKVKRLPGPPTRAPSKMGRISTARAQGFATGRYLRKLGINLDLAPVLDVPASPRSFITSRAFSNNAKAVGNRGTAFAEGLEEGGIAAAVKHFPGLGRLTVNTDFAPGRVGASQRALARDLAPFRVAIDAGVPAVMVGTASYPVYGSKLPAACAPQIVNGLLRQSLGFQGVILSDDLNTAGVRPVLPFPESAVRAVKAGIDIIYVSGVGKNGGDAGGRAAYVALLGAARQGAISRADLEASYERILELKRQVAGAK